MHPRDALHHLVDELPDQEVLRASRVLLALLDSTKEEEPLYTLDNAPEDDEPVTDDERRAIEEALRDVREGNVVPHEEVKRRWGLG